MAPVPWHPDVSDYCPVRSAFYVIEAIMLVTLGFLIATLLALAAVPALARRADRLARKRAEAAFPLSLAEIAANRDHLRAELAMRARGLEQQAERGFAAKAAAMQEVGRRDMEIARRESAISERDGRIATLEAARDELRSGLESTRAALASEEAAHAGTSDLLGERVAAIAALEEALTASREENAALSGEVAARGSELAHERAALGRLQSVLAAREQEIGLLRSDEDAMRVAQVESRTRILVLEGGHDDLAARLAAAGADIAAAQAAQAASEKAHQEEADQMREELRRRDEMLETLHAEIMRLQGALGEARAERLAARRGGASEANAELRREIVRLAEGLMALPPEREAAE